MRAPAQIPPLVYAPYYQQHRSLQMKWYARATLFVALALVVACDDNLGPETETPIVDQVRLGTASFTMRDGETFLVSATVLDQNGAELSTLPPGVTLDFSSSAPEIVSIDATGLVSALRPGTATITATAGSESGSAEVTVLPVPTHLSALSATITAGAAGTPLPNPVAVRVLDRHGSGVAGVPVTFSVTTGGGSVAAVTVTTDAAGEARTVWTLGQTVGENWLMVEATSLPLPPVSFFATGAAGTAAHLLVAGGQGQTGTVGTQLGSPLAVQVTDAFGNPVAGIDVTWNAAEGSIVGTSARSNAGGIVTGLWTLGTRAGGQAASARVDGVATVDFAATAAAGAPAVIEVVSGQAQSDTVGARLAQPLVVRVLDTYANPVPGAPVMWSGSGTVAVTAAQTDANGLASALWTLGTTVGTYNASATTTGLAPAQFTATARAGAPAALQAVSGSGQTAMAGAPLAAPLVVRVVDASGNAVAGVSVNWSVTSGTVAPGTALTAADGTAQAMWTVGTTVGAQQASATVAGLPLVAFTLAVTPAAPATITITPTSLLFRTLGETAVITATVHDAFGNIVTDANVTWSTSAAAVASVTGGTVTAVARGSAVVTAASGSVSATTTVTVAPRAVSLTITPSAHTLAALGASVALAATALDAAGAAIADAAITWSSDNTASATVDANGVVTATGNGTATITATTDSATATATITVAQQVAHVSVTPATTTLTALGATTQLAATALDANANVMANVAFAWSTSDANVASVDGNGLVTAIANGTVSISAAANGVAGSAQVIVMEPPLNAVGIIVLSSERAGSGSAIHLIDAATGTATLLHAEPGVALTAPVVSPDGTRIAFIAGGNQLRVANADGSGVIAISSAALTGLDSSSPAWAADGNSIFFTGTAGGNTDIYEIDADGANLSRVTTTPGYDGEPDVSVTGRLVFNGNCGVIVALCILDHTGVTVLRTGGGLEPRWSPDGARVAYAGVDGNIYIVNADGSNELQLTTSGGNTSPVWSTDGALLAFSSNGELRLMRTDGTGARTIAPAPGVDVPGAWVAALNARPATSVTVAPSPANVTVGGTMQLTATSSDASGTLTARPVTWSSSDVAVATVDRFGLVTAVTQGTVTITATAPEGPSGTTTVNVQPPLPPLPTGTVVFVADTVGRQSLYAMAPAGAAPVELLRANAGNAIEAPHVSADGSRIVIRYGTSLAVLNSDGTGLQSLGIDGYEPRWSPDGSRIAFHMRPSPGAQYEVYTVRSDGADLRRITTTAGWAPDFSPDGTRIAFWGKCDGGNMAGCIMNADGTGLTGPLFRDTEWKALRWSPDGTQILLGNFIGGSACIMPSNGGIGSATCIAGTLGQHHGFSPDGTHIIYAQGNAGNGDFDLFAKPLAGGSAINLTNTLWDRVERMPTWSVPLAVRNVASVTVSPGTHTLSAGLTHTFTAELRDGAGSVLAPRPLTWASSDASVATVNQNGMVTAVAPGSATIGATAANGASGSAALTVTVAAALSCAAAGTAHSSNITAPQTWTRGASPHHITAQLTVTATLTIEPGAMVCGAAQAGLTFNGAKLMAVGTATDPILFLATDSTAPWGGLTFEGTLANDSSRITHAVVAHAGWWQSSTVGNPYAINGRSATHAVSIGNTTVRQSSHGGVYLWGRKSRFVNSAVDTTIAGVQSFFRYDGVVLGDTITFQNSHVRGSSTEGLYIQGRGVRLLGGSVTGSARTGLRTSSIGSLAQATPITVTGGADKGVSLGIQDLAVLAPTPDLQDYFLGNARDTIEISGGTLTTRLVLRSDIPYHIALTSIGADGVLAPQPGAVIRGMTSARLQFLSGGRLEARGTAAAPITFAARDASSGESWQGMIFTGAPTTPSYVTNVRILDVQSYAAIDARNTHRVFIDSTHIARSSEVAVSLASSGSQLNRSVIDTTYYVPFGVSGAVVLSNGTSMNGTIVRGMRAPNAVHIVGGTVSLSNCEISGNFKYGVYVASNTGGVTINNCNITNNGDVGVFNASGFDVNATNNWWGDAAGPTGPAGDGVGTFVLFNPFLAAPIVVPAYRP